MSPGRPADQAESDQPPDIRSEIATLERRLRDGEERVRRAKEDGDWGAVERWETAWIRLLVHYESLQDRLEHRVTGDVRGNVGGYSA